MNYHQINLYGSISSYEELVDEAYNKLHEKTSKTNLGEKDNSMFGQEILEELGIVQNKSEEKEEDELLR